jgi:hypothetical protein
MKIYNNKKCYLCFQKFKTLNKNYDFYLDILKDLSLNEDILKNIIDFIEPQIYTLNIYNKIKKYYCKKCFSIAIYQYNFDKYYNDFYKYKFYQLRKKRSYEEDCYNYDTLNEIKDNIMKEWIYERKYIYYNFKIPNKIKDLIYFNSYFVSNLNSRWNCYRSNEVEYALKWIEQYKLPENITII